MPAYPKLPPVANDPLSVVLLCREPLGNLDSILSTWHTWLQQRGKDFEVILVGSLLQMSSFASPQAESPWLKPIINDKPENEGDSLRLGLSACSHSMIFYTLAQEAYSPVDLQRLFELKLHDEKELEPGVSPLVIDHVHLVTGYRAGVKMPIGLRILGWFWRMTSWIIFSIPLSPLPGWLGWRRHFGAWLTRVFFGPRYHDVACPFRLLRRDILVRSPIQSSSTFAHVELLAKANFLGFLMGEEMPINVTPEPYRGDFGVLRRDANELFNNPDFGPAQLPQEPTSPPQSVPEGA